MKIIKKILFALLLTLPLAAVADYLFKTLDAREGLTSSQVNCILKDSRGFVWFGTPAGLYRFDGYTFKNFQSDSQDGSSLNDSYINTIQETLDGNLLIETSSGYCVYHPQTESFERDMKQTFARMGIEQMTLMACLKESSVPSVNVATVRLLSMTMAEWYAAM